MLSRHQDPIAAIATAPGRGAVGIVRVSAPQDLAPLVTAICGRALKPREATYLPFRSAQGEAVARAGASRDRGAAGDKARRGAARWRARHVDGEHGQAVEGELEQGLLVDSAEGRLLGEVGLLGLEHCLAATCLKQRPQLVVGGNGVSGQAFVDNKAFREYAFKTFQANVLDMETAATAMVAHSNGVPYIAFRSLSDLAGGGDGENEMGTFMGLAAANSAKVLRAFLAAWKG